MKRALLIVDLQNDFCPGGALEVPGGDSIVPTVNKLSEEFDNVLQTQDWHPHNHFSFASQHENAEPFETIRAEYGEQVLWPDHCVQGSEGASFHPDLMTQKSQVIIRKGFRRQVDSYSAFYENDGTTETGLTGYLDDRGISDLFLCGLAADFCVKWSALDGLRKGFNVTVIEDAVKGIDLDNSVKEAWNEMLSAGARKIPSQELL